MYDMMAYYYYYSLPNHSEVDDISGFRSDIIRVIGLNQLLCLF